MRERWAPALAAAALALCAAPPAGAQLSPGELSAAHAELEGAAHCLDCHAPGEGVSPGRCLDCHRPLAGRVEEGRGLHAGEAYRTCERCHVEHHGRDFELVWWGDEGRDAFDHDDAGWELAGAHARLACRDCHRPALVRSPGTLLAAGKELDRTFLGLGTACLDCHRDEHRGQLPAAVASATGCLDCHTAESWAPAPGFDHDEAAYRLTGLHRGVPCGDCHPTTVDPRPAPAGLETATDPSFVRYRGIAHDACTDCHRDPHAGRLGATCARCHDTSGWRGRDLASLPFDHDSTRFPLLGAHRDVACRDCHGSGLGRPASARCTDCHADLHLGQIDAVAVEGCEGCHTVDGFLPARFGIAEHAETDHPLAGAHRAVPCVACHPPLPPPELRGLLLRAPAAERQLDGRDVHRFRLAAGRCADCHRDPHDGRIAAALTPAGCESCHSLAAFSPVSPAADAVPFDHARTDFPLAGRHAELACRSCHPPIGGRLGEEPAEPGALRFRDLPTACADCHADPHAGQLDLARQRRDALAGCAGCHGVGAWRPALFDHDRESRFPLVGAHRDVPCAGCHRVEAIDGREAVRYRPLPTACEGCHPAAPASGDPRCPSCPSW